MVTAEQAGLSEIDNPTTLWYTGTNKHFSIYQFTTINFRCQRVSTFHIERIDGIAVNHRKVSL